jgi:hypothetical protein
MTTNDDFWKGTEGERFEFFLNMTDEEAQAFFDQYLAARDERLLLLTQRFVRTGGGSESDLDFSPESLETIWEWAMKHLHKRDFTPSELELLMAVPEKRARDEQLRNKPLSEDTLILLNDIAYYFGEVVVRNLKGVHWKLCKARLRRYVDENQPVLGGFSAPGFELGINPRSAVRGAAWDWCAGKGADDALFRDYERCYNSLGSELPP